MQKLHSFQRGMGRQLGVVICVAMLVAQALPLLTRAQTLEGKVVEHILENGLTLLLYERHQAPIVACHVYITVGSANDLLGQTGVAHMTEHIAFKGTPAVGTTNYEEERHVLERLDALWHQIAWEYDKGETADQPKIEQLEQEFFETEQRAAQYVVSEEYSRILEEQGGVGLNASTSRDETNYFVSLPANRLELWMMLEADRLANTVPREFYREREVILEERQMRTDTSPIGTLFEQFLGTAFIAHPYGFPAIGWPSDIENITTDQLMAFYDAHYSPANMIVAIVGDIQPQAVIDMASTYFGQLPSRPASSPIRTIEPPQPGERRVEVQWDSNPYLTIGYHRPSISHEDDLIFDMIAFLLTGGRTSRLYQKLVEDSQIAIEVDSAAVYPGSKYPTLFVLAGAPLAPHTLEEVETAIYEELERLKTEPVETRELQKALNAMEASFIDSLSSNSGLAAQLTYAQGLTGDWRIIERQLETMKQITPNDIMRVAETYFTKENRTVAWLVNSGGN